MGPSIRNDNKYFVFVGKTSGFRAILIVSIVVAVIAALVVGGRVAYDVAQRRETAEAFGVLQKVADRIDLASVILGATPTESGSEIRFGSGDGPAITYFFNAAKVPDWNKRLVAAMEKAGYGIGDDGLAGAPWSIRVSGYDVYVVTSLPGEKDGFVDISTN